jgi:hypothetical protein
MKTYRNKNSRQETEPGRQRLPGSSDFNSPELHIGIDEVLGMRVGCWRPPVYVGTSVPSTRQPTAHRNMVRFQSRQLSVDVVSKDVFESRSIGDHVA